MKAFKSAKFILILTLFLVTKSLLAQATSYSLSFNPEKQDLQCTKTTRQQTEESITQVSKEECLNNHQQLVTPVKFTKGPSDICYAIIDTHPYYFAGELSDNTPCQNQATERVDFTPNMIKYSELQIENICKELGTCLTTLSDRSQELVDDTVAILQQINIGSQLTQLKASVEQDQYGFQLPKFLEQLDRLEEQNSLCHSNLNYGTGDQLAARRALADDLEKLSGTLDEDLYVFHWYLGFIRTRANDPNGNSPYFARSYADGLQDNYFSYDLIGTGYQGRGLYASPSPHNTAHFGNNMLKIRIPAGSKYFEMDSRLIPLSANTVTKLEAVGCNIKDSPHTDYISGGKVYANKMAFSTNFRCKKVFNSVIETEDYIFHTYKYNRTANSICNDTIDRAFVLIQNEMSEENVTAYNKPFAQQYNEMSDNVRDLYNLQYTRYNDLSEEERTNLREKYADHLWDCN